MLISILIIIILPALSIIYSMNINTEYKKKSWIDRVERMKPEPMNRGTYGYTVYPPEDSGIKKRFMPIGRKYGKQ